MKNLINVFLVIAFILFVLLANIKGYEIIGCIAALTTILFGMENNKEDY